MYAEREPLTQSEIERVFLRDCATVGLLVHPQFPVAKIHADFALPEKNLVIECDGKEFHPIGNTSDPKRDEIYAEHGYKVLRITGEAIHKCGQKIAEDIKLGRHDKIFYSRKIFYMFDPEDTYNRGDGDYAYADY